MYDLRVLRDNLDGLRDQLGPRGKDVAWEDLRKLTEDRRTQTVQVEELRHQLKKGSEEVAGLKRDKQPADSEMAAMKALGETIKGREEQLRLVEEQLTHIALRIPNTPHASVPVGRQAEDNLEVRRWGALTEAHGNGTDRIGISAKLWASSILTAPFAWRRPDLPS